MSHFAEKMLMNLGLNLLAEMFSLYFCFLICNGMWRTLMSELFYNLLITFYIPLLWRSFQNNIENSRKLQQYYFRLERHTFFLFFSLWRSYLKWRIINLENPINSVIIKIRYLRYLSVLISLNSFWYYFILSLSICFTWFCTFMSSMEYV